MIGTLASGWDFVFIIKTNMKGFTTVDSLFKLIKNSLSAAELKKVMVNSLMCT